MGFWSNIFKQKQNSTLDPGLAFYEKVVDQIVISETLRSEVKAELKQAFEDPKSFYDDQNDFISSERGLKYPKDVLLTPKFVLIDTLHDNGEMAEVDWREEEFEIRIFLKEISLAKNYAITIADNDLYEGYDAGEIIKLIDEKELQPQGYSIVSLDIQSDSYVFTIVPLSETQAVKLMFEKLR